MTTHAPGDLGPVCTGGTLSSELTLPARSVIIDDMPTTQTTDPEAIITAVRALTDCEWRVDPAKLSAVLGVTLPVGRSGVVLDDDTGLAIRVDEDGASVVRWCDPLNLDHITQRDLAGPLPFLADPYHAPWRDAPRFDLRPDAL